MRTLAILLLLLLFLHGVYVQAGDPSGLDRAEAVLEEAGSLEAFLQSPERVDAYYLAFEDYVGSEQIERASYDAILQQLRRLVKEAPGLAERLWEKQDLGETFVVQAIDLDALEASLGRSTALDQLLGMQEKREALLKAASPILSKSDPDQHARELLSRLQEEVARFKESLKSQALSKAALKRLQADFYSGLGASRAVHQLAAYYSWGPFTQPSTAERWFAQRNADASDLISFLWKERLALLGPVGKFLQEWRFRVLLRRFHGIFKGITERPGKCSGECVGGDSLALDSLMPERWATIAAKGSRLWLIEKGGREYKGFAHAVPVIKQQERFASLELMSEEFSREIYIERKPWEFEVRTLFEEAYRRIYAQKGSWKGFVVSNSRAADNGNARDAVFASEAYAAGRNLGNPHKLLSVEDRRLEEEIVGKTSWEEDAQYIADHENGRLIFDAVAKAANRVTLLAPPESGAKRGGHLFWNAEWVRSQLTNPETKARLFTVFANREPETLEVKRILESAAARIRKAWLAGKGGRELRFFKFATTDTVTGVLRYSGLFSPTLASTEAFRADLEYLSSLHAGLKEGLVKRDLSYFIRNELDGMIVGGWLGRDPSLLSEWPKYAFLSKRIHKQFFSAWVRAASAECGSSAICYLGKFQELWPKAVLDDGFQEFVAEDLYRGFFKPMVDALETPEEKLSVIAAFAQSAFFQASSKNVYVDVCSDALAWVRSAQGFLQLFKFDAPSAAGRTEARRDELISLTFKDFFMKWRPSAQQIAALFQMTSSDYAASALLDAMGPHQIDFTGFMDAFFALNPALDSVLFLQRNIDEPRMFEAFNVRALKESRSPEEYLKIAAFKAGQRDELQRGLWRRILQSTWDVFISRGPSEFQVTSFMIFLGGQEEAIQEIALASLQKEASSEEFFSHMQQLRYTISSYVPRWDEVAVKGFARYLALNPSVSGMHRYQQTMTKEETARGRIAEMAWARFNSKSQTKEARKEMRKCFPPRSGILRSLCSALLGL